MKRKLNLFILTFIISLMSFQIVYARVPKISYQTEMDYPPLRFAVGDQLEGFDIDLTGLIFNTQDYEVDYSVDSWDQVYERLKKGEIDTCGLVAVNDQRKKEILFTNPVMQTSISVYSKANLKNITLDNLKNYRVGVGKGQYTEDILRAKVGVINYSTYADISDAIDALNSGEIDILFENQEVVNYMLIKKDLKGVIFPQITNLFPIDVAYGVRKDNFQLLNYMNKRIEQVKKSGAYEELYQKYFFSHSQFYYESRKRGMIEIVTVLVILAITLFFIVQLYIRHLKRTVDRAGEELKKQHEWLRITLTSIGDCVISTDKKGKVTLVNDAMKKLIKLSDNEIVGKNVNEILHLVDEDNGRKIEIPINRAINNKQINNLFDNAILISGDSKRYSITGSIAPIKKDTGGNIGVVIAIQDISERKENQARLSESYQELEVLYEQIASAEEELRQQYEELEESQNALKVSEERYRLALDGCNDGVWDANIELQEIFCSGRCMDILGLSNENGIITFPQWVDMIHPGDRKMCIESLKNHLFHKNPLYKNEYRIKTSNNSYKWVQSRGLAIWDNDNKPIRIAGSLTDITESKNSEEKIYKLAYYDSLTGLPNRGHLHNYLGARINSLDKLTMLFIDLDNFKSVNDSLGHAAGDELLVKVGDALKKSLNNTEQIFRLGGDEFIVLLENVDFDDVLKGADRILEEFSTPVIINNLEFYITTSIGIANYPEHGKNVETLLRNADAAMYAAKESGKNNYKVYDPQMNAKIFEKLDMEKSLRHAIRKKEFLVYYQPQFDISSERMIGMEALVRWNHPKRGLISPGDFIPIAEETGLIVAIGEQLLKSTCNQIKMWQNKGYNIVPVAINISARQFQNGDLVELISNILRETNLDPKWLEIEITESVAMDDFEFTSDTLKKLQEIGIRVSLDDFGTGYSSLNYLKRLPINTVKIDKSFVHDLTKDSNEEAIAEAVIVLAHKMKLNVIAEGVETREELAILKAYNCDIAQGYLFSKPIPVDEVEELLMKL